MTNPGGFLEFLASTTLLVGTSLLLARAFARRVGEGLFLALPAALLQLGAAVTVTSLVSRLEPGPLLALQGVFALGAVAAARRWGRPSHAWAGNSRRGRFEPVATACWAGVAVFLAASLALQLAEPLSGWDDRMYHASRVAFWLQNHSVLPYDANNVRQVVFPFGSELTFLWPLVFVRAEWLGRLVFWLAFPLACAGAAGVLRLLRAGRRARAVAVLAIASTPIVLDSSHGIPPELWLAAALAASAFWVVKACVASGPDRPRAALLAGLCTSQALGVKTTVAGLAVIVALAAAAALVSRTYRRAGAFALLDLGAGVVFGGSVVVFAGNILRDSHPMGPRPFRSLHLADLSPRQLTGHATRTALLLAEPPFCPEGRLRDTVNRYGQSLADMSGASVPISLERTKAWLGAFRYEADTLAERFSLVGIFWVPFAAAGLFLVCCRFRLKGLAALRSPSVLLVAFQSVLVLPVIFLLRWMVNARVPERFLVGPYVLAVVLAAGWLALWNAPRGMGATVALLLGLQVFPSLLREIRQLAPRFEHPIPDVSLDEPFEGIVTALPRGARILLLADQDSRDYPLFFPREGFVNQVLPWGRAPVTAAGVHARAEAVGATHVLFTSDVVLTRDWDPPLPTAQAVNELCRNPRFLDVPVNSGQMRLFEFASARLDSKEPCQAGFLGGWYGVEKAAGSWWRWSPGRGTLWIRTEKAGMATLLFQTYSVNVPDRLDVVVNSALAAAVDVTWTGFGPVRGVRVPLRAGTNLVEISSRGASVKEEGGNRDLGLAVRNLRVLAVAPEAFPCRIRGVP